MTSELTTPDGRYIVVQGRLWRAANPTLSAERKVRYMRELLNGRRELRTAKVTGEEAAITLPRSPRPTWANAARCGGRTARPT